MEAEGCKLPKMGFWVFALRELHEVARLQSLQPLAHGAFRESWARFRGVLVLRPCDDSTGRRYEVNVSGLLEFPYIWEARHEFGTFKLHVPEL